MFLLLAIGLAVTVLAHTAPAPFVLDWMAGDKSVWAMPRTGTPTVYLTYDDGPNPATTPDLLDVLARESVSATFFIIDEHLTVETAPIVARTFAEGHSVALHSSTRSLLLARVETVADWMQQRANRIEAMTGFAPCRAFRPHAGWRSGHLVAALDRIDYTLVGFGWMLWDFNWFRAREGGATFRRVASRISDGDIVVMHDGDESAPGRDQRHTIDATAKLVPELRRRGFTFGRVCGTGRAPGL